MPDPASAQGEHILEPVAGRLDRGAGHRRHRLGPDLLRVIRFRRRSDDEIPVQTRYNLPLEIFYTIAPVIMVIVFFAHTVDDPEQRPRRRPRPTTSHRGRRPAVVVDLQLRRRREGRLPTVDPELDDEFPYDVVRPRPGTGSQIPPLVAAGRRDDPLQPALARRHPRLRRPRLPDEDGRHPRPGEPLRDHARPRSATSAASATSSAASTTRGCSSTSRSSARRSTTPTSRSSRTPAPTSELPLLGGDERQHARPGSSPATSPRRGRSDRHRRTPDQHRRRAAQAAGPAGSCDDPDHDRPQADRQALPRSRRSPGS